MIRLIVFDNFGRNHDDGSLPGGCGFNSGRKPSAPEVRVNHGPILASMSAKAAVSVRQSFRNGGIN